MSVTITDTQGFMAMARHARKKNYNRQVDIGKVGAAIDPDGRHVLKLQFVHNDDHLRTSWFVKIFGSDHPVEMWLDMDFDTLTKLSVKYSNEACYAEMQGVN
jgi:hypothetical protein